MVIILSFFLSSFLPVFLSFLSSFTKHCTYLPLQSEWKWVFTPFNNKTFIYFNGNRTHNNIIVIKRATINQRIFFVYEVSLNNWKYSENLVIQNTHTPQKTKWPLIAIIMTKLPNFKLHPFQPPVRKEKKKKKKTQIKQKYHLIVLHFNLKNSWIHFLILKE